MADELVNVPEDLKLIGDDAELHALKERVEAEFARVNAISPVTPQTLELLIKYESDVQRLRAEITTREVRAANEAKRVQADMEEKQRILAARVNENQTGELSVLETGAVTEADMESIAAAAARGTAAALFAAIGNRRGDGGGLDTLTKQATRSLTAASQHAPAVTAPRKRLAVTAGVDIPGVARGAELTGIDSVVDAFHRRARGLPVTRNGRGTEELVVTVRNDYEHTVDDRTPPAQVDELFRYLRAPEKMESLVAGGGWCAPSQIRYDFFNVACSDGLIDLPTFGVSRGGIRFPTSPSLADAIGANAFAPFSVAYSNTSVPWIWTEQDDAATVTGSTNKPCMRVPCPSFSEVRLECYGVCLTAGNLTDDAYPEATANTIRLLMAAHEHAMNARIISQMVSLSAACVTGGGFAEANDSVTQILSGASLAAVDYRARYGMCTDDVIEIVAPYWVKEVMRASFLWRSNEYEDTSVSDAEINRFFTDRNIRVQWVNDWQVRGTGQFGASAGMTAWPTTANILVYAAGTFILGNGLTLDLGVVRDSVLNAENDHTAAWSEECHLLAMVGHASRCYSITFSVSALTAPAATSAPNL